MLLDRISRQVLPALCSIFILFPHQSVAQLLSDTELASKGVTRLVAESRFTGNALPNLPNAPEAPAATSGPLKVLTYNVFMRPVSPLTRDDQDERANLLPSHLGGYDVIVFQEMFSNAHRKQILSGIAAEYPYQTHLLGRDGRPLPISQDGGVVVVSKWPIEREFQRLFSDLCVGSDCIGDKGVLYARVNWNGNPVHIFGTHTQSGDSQDERQTREVQLVNIDLLIDSMGIPADQPVLIAGDLNVDLYVNNEYSAMLSILSANHPEPQSGGRGYTSDPANDYVSDENKAKYLDYVLYSNKHLKPDQAFNDVRILKADGKDLSDHYPVEGNYSFSGVNTAPATFPFAAFFEGNDAEHQDFHCNVSMEREKEIVFDYPEECDGDQVRSLVLYDVPAERVLRLYDNSEGSREDDWVEIVAKTDIREKVIGTFEQSFEDDEVLVTYYRVNGLDGKVSRLEVDFCATACDPVSIISPEDGTTIPAGSPLIVKVWAQLGVTDVQLYADGGLQQIEGFDGESAWSFRWNVPPMVDQSYDLQAVATIDGRQEQSKIVTVTTVLSTEVTFEAPDPNVPVAIGQPVTVIVSASSDTASIDLQVSPGDADSGGPMVKNASSGKWEYRWTPEPPAGIETQTYSLRAVAYDNSNVLLDDDRINLTAQGVNPGEPRIEAPPIAFAGSQVTITVVAPGANGVTLTINGTSVPLSLRGSKWVFEWFPPVGTYHIEAFADYGGGIVKSTTWNLQVQQKPDLDITQINRYAMIGTIPEYQPHASLYFGGSIPTGIATSGYACSVVGFSSRGGDIGEVIDHGSDLGIHDIVGVYAIPGGSEWFAFADFNTLHLGWLLWPVSRDIVYEDRPEKWWLQLLCVTKDVASFHSFRGLGDNIDFDTSIRHDEKACTIAGFRANEGDINEKGTHTIIQTYLERRDGTWRIRADFASHRGDKGGHEDWDAHLLCIDREVAALDGPSPGKPFFLREYSNLGDNVGPRNEFSTGYSVDDYHCGIAGFAARDGDIDEHDKNSNTNLFSAYMYPNDGEWHVRADFRSHKNSETWDVNVLCAARGDGPPGVLENISHEAQGLDNCMGESMRCQILKDEAIELSGVVTVSGGGFEGNPSQKGTACPGFDFDQIEVYVDDRDPGTGKPRWSYPPDQCLVHGESITLATNRSYDFRGVSLVGGATVPFTIQSGAALAPDMKGAAPKLFPKPYGPGVALTWEPTVSPAAAYYEIQFSEDVGDTWQTYTRSRNISHGGWINHHGNLSCGDGFTRCLKSAQQYRYRVRVLDSAKAAISGWSNTISTVSMDWADLPPPNRRPTITAPSFISVYFKDTVSFTVRAVDPDGDQLQILVDRLPNGATLSPTSGTGSVTATFFWDPPTASLGDHEITFIARDKDGATSTTITTINVCDGSNDCLL